MVEAYIIHENGTKLQCHEYWKESIFYDHIGDRFSRNLDSIGFKTSTHAKPPGIQCTNHGMRKAVIPLSEHRSMFTMKFESKSIRNLQNIDLHNFTEIMGISWNQVWVSVLSY